MDVERLPLARFLPELNRLSAAGIDYVWLELPRIDHTHAGLEKANASLADCIPFDAIRAAGERFPSIGRFAEATLAKALFPES